MITIFKSKIVKGNNKGVGFIKIPPRYKRMIQAENQHSVMITAGNLNVDFHAYPRNYTSIGFYIPTRLVKQYDLLGKEVTVTTKKIDGFFSSLSSDGIVRIPNQQAKLLNLKKGEIILIKSTIANKIIEKYSKVNLIKRSGKQDEYITTFSRHHSKLSGTFQIKKIPKNKLDMPMAIKNAIWELNSAPIEKNKLMLFLGNRVPITINYNISLSDFAHYLGFYFADGTKRGNNWGMTASTFLQGRYCLEKHNQLIDDANLSFGITLTTPQMVDEELKCDTAQVWNKGLNLKIPKEKVRIIKTKTKDALNRNLHGTLVMKEFRQLTMIYYNKLLKQLLNKIQTNQDKQLAWDFLCGVLEGDGYPTTASRPGIGISTNPKEMEILKKVFAVLNLKNQGHLEKEGMKKAILRIGIFEIINNFEYVHDKLFKYYPKRRKRLIDRLFLTGSVKQILGKQKLTSPWVKSSLRKLGIFNKNYKLTKKGEMIKKCLIKMGNELK